MPLPDAILDEALQSLKDSQVKVTNQNLTDGSRHAT
jgi:ATP-dependent helicase/nuclease subunit A